MEDVLIYIVFLRDYRSFTTNHYVNFSRSFRSVYVMSETILQRIELFSLMHHPSAQMVKRRCLTFW